MSDLTPDEKIFCVEECVGETTREGRLFLHKAIGGVNLGLRLTSEQVAQKGDFKPTFDLGFLTWDELRQTFSVDRLNLKGKQLKISGMAHSAVKHIVSTWENGR